MLSTQQPQQQQPQPQQTQDAPCLTSTTAPGKIFTSRAELQEHYKSDWHRYNLKRREAGLPLLNESDFTARLEAALALRNERQPHEEKNGTSHLKSDKEHKKKKKTKEQRGDVVAISQAAAYDRMKNPTIETTAPTSNMEVESSTLKANQDSGVVEDAENDDNNTPSSSEPEALPEIDPCQSLFDSFISESVQANVTRMHQLYGFFIPDQEYLVDLEGLLGYAQEKIKLGHTCLYCQKLFSTWQGCQRHMVSLSHTKLKYERGIDLDEWDPFYDFTSANEEFFQTATVNKRTKTKAATTTMANADDKMEEDGEEWEDVSEDDDADDGDKEQAGDAMEEDKATNNNDEDDEDMYAGYQDEIAKYGFDVTPLGELILPDGRIIGHRGLARYYKQRLNPLSRTSANPSAVSAARLAAGERIIRGRVLQLFSDVTPNNHQNHPLALTTTSAGGLVSSSHFKTSIGRAGQGILVPNKAGGNYTALSLYRYRAVVRKQRRDDDKGRRLFNKTYQNINRMDKKANNKMNGVSVAHALR